MNILNKLRDYNILKKEADRLKIQLYDLQKCFVNTQEFKQHTKGGLNTNPVEERFYIIKEIEQKYYDKIIEYETLKFSIENAINKLENANQKLVLKLYYIDNLSVETIATKLDYSCDHINRLKGSGIRNLINNKNNTKN